MQRGPEPSRRRVIVSPHPPALPPREALWPDLLAVILIWSAFVVWAGQGRLVFAYDVFREMAYAHGIARGHLRADPSLPGQAAWYPPGNPMFMAAAATLTRIPLTTLYGTSVYWLQWVLPVLLFLLVRGSWGRFTAWLALPFVFLGSNWW